MSATALGLPTMDLLRFATAGSVDDGKSTLIGRLLLDSKSIFEDQLEAVEATSQSRGYDYTDLALLTDGLRSEREQGITIDVAYRYFATPNRKFIIAGGEPTGEIPPCCFLLSNLAPLAGVGTLCGGSPPPTTC
jgi:hypothetical protein